MDWLERHNRHSQYPDLERDENHVLSFGIAKAVKKKYKHEKDQRKRVIETYTETGQLSDHKQLSSNTVSLPFESNKSYGRLARTGRAR